MFLNNQDLWCCLVLIDYSLEGEELSADKMRSRCFVSPPLELGPSFLGQPSVVTGLGVCALPA